MGFALYQPGIDSIWHFSTVPSLSVLTAQKFDVTSEKKISRVFNYVA